MEAHAHDLRAEVDDPEFVERFTQDWRQVSLSPSDEALLGLAERLTREPWATRSGDLEALRAHGLDDQQISDAVQIVGYFNYINRIADGLGVDLEDFMAPRTDARGTRIRGT